MIEEKRFPSIEDAAGALAGDLADSLGRGIAERGQASIAVSGGRTPHLVFPLLAAAELSWDKVFVTLTDERWVDGSHPESNQGLARRCLLTGAAAAARFIPLKSPAATPEAGLGMCAAALDGLPWPLDAVFLGMGADGHIASLFPGDKGWQGGPGRCVAVPGAEGRHPRMSLSAGALLDSRRIFLVLSGAAKRRTLEAARRRGPAAEFPLRLVLDQQRVPVCLYIAD